MIGGYKIISFEGYTFKAGTAQAVAGLHKRIEESRKPFLIRDLVVGSDELKPEFATATGGSPYVIKLATYTIIMATDDKVTITANA